MSIITAERQVEQAMAFTKAQYEEVKTLVETGRIDIARRLLEEIDDEKAHLLLDKLNQKYPFTLADAKRLLGQQRYEDAEKILWNLDDPEATTLLEKLTLVKTKMKATTTAPAVSSKQGAAGSSPFITSTRPALSPTMNTKTKAQPGRSGALSPATMVTIGGGVILVLLLVVLVQVVQQRQRPSSIQAALKEVCIKLERIDPEPGYEDLTTEQIAADCGAAAQDLYEESPDVANICYDIVVDKTDALEWTSCLADKLEPEEQEEAQSF